MGKKITPPIFEFDSLPLPPIVTEQIKSSIGKEILCLNDEERHNSTVSAVTAKLIGGKQISDYIALTRPGIEKYITYQLSTTRPSFVIDGFPIVNVSVTPQDLIPAVLLRQSVSLGLMRSPRDINRWIETIKKFGIFDLVDQMSTMQDYRNTMYTNCMSHIAFLAMVHKQGLWDLYFDFFSKWGEVDSADINPSLELVGGPTLRNGYEQATLRLFDHFNKGDY